MKMYIIFIFCQFFLKNHSSDSYEILKESTNEGSYNG